MKQVLMMLLVAGVASADVSFTAKPAVKKDGDRCRISFAVSAPTDVEVAILDTKGAVVRHLAAGMLGGPGAPPEPLKPGLAQEIEWDGRDDASVQCSVFGVQSGIPPPATRHQPLFRARVRVGARPCLDKIVSRVDNAAGRPMVGLTVGKDGEVFVLASEFYRGGTEMRVFDRNGKYLRTIMPYAADTPKERTASVGHLEIEGERIPIVFNGLGKTMYPLTSGMRQQNMAWHPKGYLVMVSALGTMAEQAPPRYLLALHPQGGAPEGVNFVGPQLRKGTERMLGGAGEGSAGLFDHVAVSPAGDFTYMSVGPKSRFGVKGHGVLRLKWDDKEAGAFFVGNTEPGADNSHFNTPEGLAVDAKGNLYVCDWGNNRIVVCSAEGKTLGTFAVEKPQQIAVHPAGGEIFVLSVSALSRWGRVYGDDAVVRKFSPFAAQGGPRELARLDAKGMSLMALDASAAPARLWLAGNGLVPVTDKGAQLEAGPSVLGSGGLVNPGYIAADPERNRVLIFLYDEKVTSLDLASGKMSLFCKGTDMALDHAGNVYVMGGRDNAIYRYDPGGKPLPFAASGSNKIMTKGYRGYGPNMGFGGIAVDVRGNIYVVRNSNYGGSEIYGGRVDVFGPDGQPKKESLIDGLGYGDCGLGVDAAGNIYVGSNLKPADKPLPAAFVGKVPDKSWTWWRGPERDIPWRYTYYNPYLWHWGAVFKFGPEGGMFYGQHPWLLKDAKYTPRPSDKLENAPAGAFSLRSACLGWEVKVAGAKWRYQGCSFIPSSGDALQPDPGCVCYNSQLAVDPYGRVYAPNVFRFGVEMLDAAGNLITRIGRYGNADDAARNAERGMRNDETGITGSLTGSPHSALRTPNSAIHFAWPAFVSAAGEKVYVADPLNRQVVVVRFDHAAEATAEIR